MIISLFKGCAEPLLAASLGKLQTLNGSHEGENDAVPNEEPEMRKDKTISARKSPLEIL